MTDADRSGRDDRRVEAIAAVYAAERQDLSALMGHSLTLLGVIIAYVGVAAGILGGGSKLFGQALFPVVLAFPTWMVIAFHVVLMANVLAHGRSTMILEQSLLGAAGLNPATQEQIGHRAGERVTNVLTQPAALKTQTLVAYGGVGLLVVGFTIYSVDVTASRTGGWLSVEVLGSVAFYLVLLGMTTWAWWKVLSEQ